jgi:inosine-uridine nucleoside N-ribohydrolase
MKILKEVVLIFYCLTFLYSFLYSQKVIIDADTGNEIDDVPAISYALMSDELDVIGLTAEQWNRVEICDRQTMLESWDLNNRILKYLNKTDIPSFKGAETMVGKQWALEPPRSSDASSFIINSALEHNDRNKLKIICTGAATNVASAIMLNPSIVDKIAVYFIGFKYNFDRKAISKNEFNVRNDLNAIDVLLDTEGLELHIMPANVCENLIFNKKDTFSRLSKKIEIESLFLERWEKVGKNHSQWIMWDIGIIAAVMHPEWAIEIIHSTPPENFPRHIYLYTDIDETKIKDNFWKIFTNK